MATSFAALVKRFARDERGASLVEYAVLIGIITAGLVTAITALRTEIIGSFTAIGALLPG
ncbi:MULTISPECIES: Flp family type IVb pilin [Rhodomicrobium]|uniref:Flp family type IVb pilin n=1 Tax=Rhodomicrobium TaxID=1068 RepID=UPI000B4AEAEA|nr:MULTISPECIES: Flp family type IVb pilin [Rhodomicrobium]